MKIVILRHGKPVTPSLRKLSASAFSEWVHKYNAAGLCPTSQPTEHAKKCADECNAVVCSALPRSIESAKALNNKSIVCFLHKPSTKSSAHVELTDSSLYIHCTSIVRTLYVQCTYNVCSIYIHVYVHCTYIVCISVV